MLADSNILDILHEIVNTDPETCCLSRNVIVSVKYGRVTKYGVVDQIFQTTRPIRAMKRDKKH